MIHVNLPIIILILILPLNPSLNLNPSIAILETPPKDQPYRRFNCGTPADRTERRGAIKIKGKIKIKTGIEDPHHSTDGPPGAGPSSAESAIFVEGHSRSAHWPQPCFR